MWLFLKKFLLNFHDSRNDKPFVYCIQCHNNFAAYFGVFFVYIWKYITTQSNYNTCVAI